MTINSYIWRELRRLMRKYDVVIRWNSQNDIYYVYTKNGKLEFEAHGINELKSTLHLYYD